MPPSRRFSSGMNPNPQTESLEAAGPDPVVRALEALRGGAARVSLTGLKGAARGHLLSRLSRAGAGPFVCVVADEDEADALEADLRFFLGPGSGSAPAVLRLPADDRLPY